MKSKKLLSVPTMAEDLVLDTTIRDWVEFLFFSFSGFFYHGSDCASLFSLSLSLFFFFFFLGFSTVMSDDGCGSLIRSSFFG